MHDRQLSIWAYMQEWMEEVDIGLCEETVSETSPADFDEAPHEPPAKKCRKM